MVQEWAGHMNEATSKHYQHLCSDKQQQAINLVFGEVNGTAAEAPKKPQESVSVGGEGGASG
jgi:hypothetical protein